MIPVIPPLKDHVIDSCPKDRKNQRVHREVKIGIRILSPPFRVRLRDQKPRNHSDSDDQPIIGKGDSADGKAFCHMLDRNTQMYKADIRSFCHIFSPFLVCESYFTPKSNKKQTDLHDSAPLNSTKRRGKARNQRILH